MIILALEFSSHRRSVALARDGKVLAEAVEQTAGRGTNAFALIEKTLAEANLMREAVDTLAVGLGPGSYTGIRAAIAIAQGWQLATGVKLLGISSAEAIAAQAQEKKLFGRVNVVIDAQRGEFYRSIWNIAGDSLTELEPLKIVSGEAIKAGGDAGGACVGPESDELIFPAARTIARLATGRPSFVTGETLEPIYLRETSFIKAGPTRVI